MKCVVKVGTQSILTPEGKPLQITLKALVRQLAALKKMGHSLVFVSSGAVGLGRKIAREILGKEYRDSLAEKQVLASLGQHELMFMYSELFKEYSILTSQLLLTKKDFYTRHHYLNIARLIQELLKNKNIIPILNENDTVSIEELMFTDNDELAGLIAAQINADKLIILTNTEGVYTENPQDLKSELIKVIDPKKNWPKISSSKSIHGRGGMVSKLSTAKKMARLGIQTQIASLSQPDILIRLIDGEEIGTTILADQKKSNIKKWIAYSEHEKTGKIVINECLCQILKNSNKAISLLPVGIEWVEGDFLKGDVVEIFTSEGALVGMGFAKYDSKKLADCIGKKNKPVFIHYDHLYLL